MATWVTQACAEDVPRGIWVRGGSFERLTVLEVVVIKDTRHLERVRGLEVVVVVGERHPGRVL